MAVEPFHLSPTVAEGALNALISDLAQRGPVRMLVYDTNSAVAVSPAYANADQANSRLICETVVSLPVVNGLDIIFANIPDMRAQQAGNIDMIEFRSTDGDILFFRVAANGKRVAQYDLIQIEEVKIRDGSTPAVSTQFDLYPNNVPFPAEYKVTYPAYMGGNVDVIYSNILLRNSTGLIFTNSGMFAPDSTLCNRVVDPSTSALSSTGDYYNIEGEWSREGGIGGTVYTLDFVFRTTSPDMLLNAEDRFDINLSVQFKESDDYNSSGNQNAKPVIQRRLHGESSFTTIPVTNAYVSYRGTDLIYHRTWSFKLTQ